MLFLLYRLSLSRSYSENRKPSKEICSLYSNDEFSCKKNGCMYTIWGKCQSYEYSSANQDFKTHKKHIRVRTIEDPKPLPVQYSRPKTDLPSTIPEYEQKQKALPPQKPIKYSIDNTISHLFPQYQMENFDLSNNPPFEANSKNSKQQNTCFATYSPDGCPTCHSRDPSVTCGWCQSQGFCAEGTNKKATSAKCPKKFWIFNQTQCNSVMCSMSVTKETCRMPCTWSLLRGKCVVPVSFIETANSVINSVEEKIKASYGWIIASACIFAACIIVAITGFVFNSKQHVYQKLPAMKSNFNLNEIPNL